MYTKNRGIFSKLIYRGWDVDSSDRRCVFIQRYTQSVEQLQTEFFSAIEFGYIIADMMQAVLNKLREYNVIFFIENGCAEEKSIIIKNKGRWNSSKHILLDKTSIL